MHRRFAAYVLLLFAFCCSWQQALANSTESAQANAIEYYVRKINFECGINLTMEYDHASLKKNNKDIGWDQTGGDNECNEPLRYIWYSCKSAAGKAALKKLAISKVICRGTAGKTGKLTRSGTTIIVERAYEESGSYTRNLKQFLAATGIALKIKNDDPYHDNDWDDFRKKENPVTDSKSYCLAAGKKKPFSDYNSIFGNYKYLDKNGRFQCWNEGVLILDMQLANGLQTGFESNIRDDRKQVGTYKSGKRHGDQKDFEKNKLKSHSFYNMDKEVWKKEYFDSGKLNSYKLYLTSGYAEVGWRDDGKISEIGCRPEVKGDAILSKLCGFGQINTVNTYDNSGKLRNSYVFKDGVMQSQKGGNSDYGAKSDVKFRDGKKNGLEKYFGKSGKLSGTIVWSNGLKSGPEKTYHTDGKKIVKLINWKDDEMVDVTDFYLNENPKLKETFVSAKKKKKLEYYDDGKLREEGVYVKCQSGYGNGWCEDGVHKRYFENGKIYSEVAYKEGKISGTVKTWYDNGKVYRTLEYVNDKIRSSREYSLEGKLVESVEYEEDGSKKVKKK